MIWLGVAWHLGWMRWWAPALGSPPPGIPTSPLWGALGTDAPLWGLSAMDLMAGAPARVSPGYPALIALFSWGGSQLVSAGRSISIGAAALLQPLAYLGARSLGVGRPTALLLALFLLFHPSLMEMALQVQPDTLTALAILGLAVMGAHTAKGAGWSGLAMALIGGLLPLIREHGLPLALLTGLGCLVLPGSWSQRRWRLGLLLATLALGPLLLGQPRGILPWTAPWADRAGGALAAFTTRDPDSLSYLNELPRGPRLAYANLVRAGDRPGQLRWHAGRALALAPVVWGLVGAALLAALSTRRREILALAAPLLVALPALAIWSQARHVVVLLPVAMLVLAVAARSRRIPRLLFPAGLLLLALPSPRQARELATRQLAESARARQLAATAAELCALEPGLLGGRFQDLALYCPRPRHDPDGTAADWITVVAEDRPPTGTGWVRVGGEVPGIGLFRLQPTLQGRPCRRYTLAPGIPYLSVGLARATVISCDPPVTAAPGG